MYNLPVKIVSMERGREMKHFMKKIEWLLNLGGIKKDVVLLAVSGIALLFSIFPLRPIPFDAAWIAIVFCGLPIILEAVRPGLVTQFDIKADVLVSLALIASVCIGEIFAAGEVAFIMQLGGLLEELTVARARAGIEKLVHLTPQTARIITDGSGKNHSGRASKGRGRAPRFAGGNGSRRRNDYQRTNIGSISRYDRRITAG